VSIERIASAEDVTCVMDDAVCSAQRLFATYVPVLTLGRNKLTASLRPFSTAFAAHALLSAAPASPCLAFQAAILAIVIPSAASRTAADSLGNSSRRYLIRKHDRRIYLSDH
jgi:hypothetical protein